MDNPIEVQDLELESLIGFDGRPSNGLWVHPDGVHLIYPLGTNITVYDWCTKKQRFLEGLTNVVSSIAVSKTGKYVGAGQVTSMGFRSPIIVWAFETGQIVTKYEAHNVRVETVSFSCCETYMISLGGLDDGSVLVYDIEKKEVLATASSVKSTAGVSTVLTPARLRGHSFVVAGDNILRLWTVVKEQRRVEGLDVSFAKIKRKILCVEIDDADTHAYCGTSTGDMIKLMFNFSPDADVPLKAPTVVGCYAKYPAAVKNKKKCCGRAASGHIQLYSNGITSLHLLADGTIIVGTGAGIVELVSLKARPGKPVCAESLGAGHYLVAPTSPLIDPLLTTVVHSSVTSINVINGVVLVGTVNCELFTVKLSDFTTARMFTCHTSGIHDLVFPHDYSLVFATASKNDVRVWSVKTLQELLRITVNNTSCSGVLFSYDGTRIVTSWSDGKIRTFTPEHGRLLYTIHNCHNNGVSAIAITRDGKKLISGGGDGQVRIWWVDQLADNLLAVLKEHKGPVNSICVHENDLQAVTASTDGTCVIWDIVRYVRLSVMFSTTVFTGVKYHPNKVQLLTCGTNRFIGYWESIDGSLVHEVEGSSSSALNALDLTPAGNYFVTGSADLLVKVWHYKEGVPTHVGVGHAGVLTNVKVSPDCRLVVSTSVDGGIFLWRFPFDPDIDPPRDGGEAVVKGVPSRCSQREQQTERSRQLSQKKKLPVKAENIKKISKTQKVNVNLDAGVGGADAKTANVTKKPGTKDAGTGDKIRVCK
ncbi:WD40/YVTN repeat-like-containing domain,WD40 repeat, conserved site,WD40 repeat,WD40-repeat-containing [Cinara cedri]|uniref:Cilia- and flagella-associated protein 52 n=1 Tax=Cinara cedri TaxID=506608 RepID=A0A5E4MSR1_9HEMI|nr:WD40/YVTN repeat-like-containing domain,WD40 repeat, conserved site,WD40 repeat,WD40-repeat-containing [Cinara cedri]